MIDRRHFLIGAGTLLTTSFVRRASAFSQKAGGPLILPSVRKPEETLYVNLRVRTATRTTRSPNMRAKLARLARA